MADPWGGGDSDDDFGEEKSLEPKKDSLVILIDCRENMFEKNTNGEVCL
jgi:hypothetical protein